MSSREPAALFLPTGLVLPYYARPDLAYYDPVYDHDSGLGLVWTATVPEGSLEVVSYATFTMLASATVIDRTPQIIYKDQTGATLWSIPSTGSFAATQTATVTVIFGSTANYFAGTSFVIGVPQTLMLPGAKVFFQALNYQADDRTTSLNYTRLLVPTGPAEDISQASVAPVLLA